MTLAILTNTSVVQGLVGRGGEEYCLFMGSMNSPAEDRWAWFYTEEEAEKWASDNGVVIIHKCSERR